MIPFFDAFAGNFGSSTQGAPVSDLPSEGTRNTDVGRVLEGISDAVEGGRGFINAFTDTNTGPGTRRNAPVEVKQGGSSGTFFGLNLNEPLGKLALVAVAVAVFFFARRFFK